MGKQPWSRMSRSVSERTLLACCLLIACSGCRGTGGDQLLPEQTSRKEIFWKHVLSTPPELVPIAADPGTTQKIERLCDRLSEAPITGITPILDGLRD